MKVRAASEQSIPEELVQRIGDLTARFAELSEYVRCATNAREGVGLNDAENFARPIEFLTENGFAIVRRWEADGSPAPADGRLCFLVRDPDGAECVINTEIGNQLIADTAFRTRGHIQSSSSFWICCAERHLADYVTRHDGCPDGNQLAVECLDCEEVMLALRWERSDF
ncbi:MAG: hypothetical protein WAQ99_17670 [Pyrinomonadaceae bacterium]